MSLLAQYKFKNNGNSETGSYNMTIPSGTIEFEDLPPFIRPEVGKFAKFIKGKSPASAPLPLGGASNFSISYLAKAIWDGSGAYPNLSLGLDSSQRVLQLWNGGGTTCNQFDSSSGQLSGSASPGWDSATHHFVVTRSTATNLWSFYCDGVLIHTVSFGGGSLPGSSLPFYFGSYHAGTTNYCTAYIANFKFYNHALSTQEITADYAENFILPGTPLATGGDQSYLVANPDGTFDEVHIFRKTGILSSPKKLKRSHVFGNASGGSGGNFGSGSSGGAFEDDDYAISPGDHQIVIGEPGLGVAYNVATGQPGEDLTFDDMIAYGGAPGSNGYAQLGGSVGSGDGTSNTADKPRQPEPKRGIGKYVYGNTCGTLTSGIYYACPGSGGIGGVGGNSSNGSTQGGNYGNTKGGAAGPGKTITLTGESIIVGVGAPGCAGTNRADVVPGAPLGRNGGDNENGVNAISYGSGSPGIAGRQSSHKTGAAKKGIFVVRFPVKQRGGNNPAMLMALLP